MTPEDRAWQQLMRTLDRIETKLDSKVDKEEFRAFEHDVEAKLEDVEREQKAMRSSAVTPDQVGTMVGSKLQESNARGITNRERWTRYTVAGVSIATFALILYDRLRSASGRP